MPPAKSDPVDGPVEKPSFRLARRQLRVDTLNAVWNTAISLWAEPAVKNAPPRGRRDWALAAIVAAAVAIEGFLRTAPVWWPAALGLGLALAVGVLFRRTRPLIAVAFAFGMFAALDVATFVARAEPLAIYSGAAVLAPGYSLFRWGAGRDVAIGLGVMAVAFTASVITDFTGASDTIGGVAVLLCTAALGVAVRYRAAARGQLVERARFQEREQLARELHDTVAHHVSAIAIQAQAGLVLAQSSSLSGATEALEVIDREAGKALAEMRTMVGALRDRDKQTSLAPQRGIADIAELAANGGGPLRVNVDLRGDLAKLPPAVEAALYRVAQESLTNAHRHARQASRVEIRLTGHETDVELTVSDDGARPAAASNSPGYGLTGMTERVALLGGMLTAGPGPGSGWRVRAVLPRRGSAT